MKGSSAAFVYMCLVPSLPSSLPPSLPPLPQIQRLVAADAELARVLTAADNLLSLPRLRPSLLPSLPPSGPAPRGSRCRIGSCPDRG